MKKIKEGQQPTKLYYSSSSAAAAAKILVSLE